MQELWKHAYQAQYGVDPDQEIATLQAKQEEWRVNWQGGYDAGEDWATAMVADVAPPQPPEDVPVPDVSRESIMRIAAGRAGIPYQLDPPPDGVNTLDCSLYVLVTYRDAGLPFAAGIRTAEQIRQACTPIGWDAIAPGDLLFFEHTYEPNEPAGLDGHTASHIGISLGAGTHKMWDAHDPGGVQQTDISSQFWQEHLFEARRAPGLAAAPQPSGGLTSDPDHQFALPDLYPAMQRYGQQYGFDPQVLAAICYQESGFKNWRVHMDGTGFGLFGLDDNGLLPDFERWSGLSVGRGQSHGPVAPEKQIEYAAMQLRRYQDAYGDAILAAQAWHRGGGAYQDALGVQYGNLIRAHMQRLFG